MSAETVEVKKVTVNLPETDIQLLRELAASRHTTMTEVLRSAIKTEVFIERTTAGGSKVLVKAPDDTLREVIFLPSITTGSSGR